MMMNIEQQQVVLFGTIAWVEPIPSFDQMGIITDDLLGSIYQYIFEKPSAIQQGRAMLLIIKGYDVIDQAHSGIGKSSIMIPVVACQMVATSITEVHILFLSPTREGTSQTDQVILAIANCINMQAHEDVGVKSVGEFDNMRKLECGVQVVSGTPGIVCDMIERTLRTKATIKLLDESEEMLTRYFKDQIYGVYRYLPPELQVVLVSRTLPNEIVDVTIEFVIDPARMLVKCEDPTLEGIRQIIFAVEDKEWEFDTLCDLHDHMLTTQAVIFCSTKQKVDWLCEKMHSNNFTVLSMHGDMPQKEQDAILAGFRQTNACFLFTTDVWARWLDVE
ncbi:hypothetical protein AQUCO_11800027v1 [Aquilegia coerulea]|uniref:RNA helicase n=1 Tax=Aquilegia coerulea TaxID=218851 RepID=A0A2G5C241_AQUCA|nr:hypothetical protein AQUCO_11800027v1 [Aquilegia coerulea]